MSGHVPAGGRWGPVAVFSKVNEDGAAVDGVAI